MPRAPWTGHSATRPGASVESTVRTGRAPSPSGGSPGVGRFEPRVLSSQGGFRRLRHGAPIFQILLIAAAVLISASAQAQPTLGAAGEEAVGGENPWRGSQINYSNVVGLTTIDRSVDLTYNPYYAMQATLFPRYWLSKKVHLRLRTTAIHEFTQADLNTLDNETVLTDTFIGLAANLWTMPGLGINTAVTFDVRTPTSKWSRGDDMLFGLVPAIGLSRTFPVLKGLTLIYGLQVTRFFHQYNTGSLETPRIQSCSASIDGCARYDHDGVSNPRWRFLHSGVIALGLFKGVTLSASAAIFTDYLRNFERSPEANVVEEDPVEERHFISYGLDLDIRPWKVVGFGINASSFGPQLAPDSTFRTPFINRLTTIQFDLRLNVGALLDGDSRG